jgi:hypothetical protein
VVIKYGDDKCDNSNLVTCKNINVLGKENLQGLLWHDYNKGSTYGNIEFIFEKNKFYDKRNAILIIYHTKSTITHLIIMES